MFGVPRVTTGCTEKRGGCWLNVDGAGRWWDGMARGCGAWELESLSDRRKMRELPARQRQKCTNRVGAPRA